MENRAVLKRSANNLLFLEDEFVRLHSDIVFKVNSAEEIPACRFVLGAISPLFSSIFSDDPTAMVKECVVLIPGVARETLQSLLQLAVTGRVRFSSRGDYHLLLELMQLLHVEHVDNCDFYQVETSPPTLLKSSCQLKPSEQAPIDNVTTPPRKPARIVLKQLRQPLKNKPTEQQLVSNDSKSLQQEQRSEPNTGIDSLMPCAIDSELFSGDDAPGGCESAEANDEIGISVEEFESLVSRESLFDGVSIEKSCVDEESLLLDTGPLSPPISTHKSGGHECTECNTHFTSARILERHLKTNHTKKNRTSKKRLTVKPHRDSREHECLKCGNGFSTAGALRTHAVSQHSAGGAQSLHRCPHCDYSHRLRAKVNYHMRRVHQRAFEHHECSYCDKKCSTRFDLNLHVTAVHLRRRSHVCELCGAAFLQRPHLQTHLRLHTGERPFLCGHCGKAFLQTSTLQYHMRTKHALG